MLEFKYRANGSKESVASFFFSDRNGQMPKHLSIADANLIYSSYRNAVQRMH